MSANPGPPVPEASLGDVFKLLTAIGEAVASGQTTVPVIKIKVAGHHVSLGPIPIAITP